jgi:hypothetical protein
MKYWFIPKQFRSINLPMKLVITYKRIMLEDLPQLGVQLVLFFLEEGFKTTSNLISFISSCLTIFLSLREAWNAKPSRFDINKYKSYVRFLLNEPETEQVKKAEVAVEEGEEHENDARDAG